MITVIAVAVAVMTLVYQMGEAAKAEVAATVSRTQGAAGTLRIDIGEVEIWTAMEALRGTVAREDGGRSVPLGTGQAWLPGGDDAVSVTVVAVDPSIEQAVSPEIYQGRWFEGEDAETVMAGAVLSPAGARQIAEQEHYRVGGSDQTGLIGLRIQLDSPMPTYVQVVGVAGDGPLVRNHPEADLFVALGTRNGLGSLRAWAARSDGIGERLALFVAGGAQASGKLETSLASVNMALRASGATGPEVSGARIDSADDFNGATSSLATILRVIGFTVLAVAVAGVAIVSMASLRERAGELALRRAVGWSKRSVTVLVLTETLMIVLAGAVAGVVAAALGCTLLTKSGITAQEFGLASISVGTMIAALSASLVLGASLGLIPALKAGKRDPITLLSG
jgi:hypothetical protein